MVVLRRMTCILVGKSNGSNPVHELIPGLERKIGISLVMAGSTQMVPGLCRLINGIMIRGN